MCIASYHRVSEKRGLCIIALNQEPIEKYVNEGQLVWDKFSC